MAVLTRGLRLLVLLLLVLLALDSLLLLLKRLPNLQFFNLLCKVVDTLLGLLQRDLALSDGSLWFGRRGRGTLGAKSTSTVNNKVQDGPAGQTDGYKKKGGRRSYWVGMPRPHHSCGILDPLLRLQLTSNLLNSTLIVVLSKDIIK